MSIVDELKPGDFLYQANDELFLVVTDVDEHTVETAVHGWRVFDKERLQGYLDADRPVIHTEEQVNTVIEHHDDPHAEEKLEWLKQIFEKYKVAEIEQDSAHDDFALDDTE